MTLKTKKEELKVNGKWRELVTVKDEKGNVLHKVLNPLMVEFRIRDLLQVLVGASLLALPVAYTEETWALGQSLPLMNVLLLGILSVFFIGTFVYYNYYKGRMSEHKINFFKRVLFTYLVSFLVVAMLLTLIQRAPWNVDLLLAIKRTILVAFPASMSAAVADMLK